MKPCIENVEVVSFRLKVPLQDLERVAESETGRLLGLTLEYDANELVLSETHAECTLRFRPIGTEAMLSEVLITRDQNGAFFERVLLPLAVRFRGDLHMRLMWNDSERNAHGNFTEVKVQRGVMEDPPARYARPPPLPTSTESGEQVASSDPEPPMTQEEQEIQELLARARASWEEYQRLKSGKS